MSPWFEDLAFQRKKRSFPFPWRWSCPLQDIICVRNSLNVAICSFCFLLIEFVVSNKHKLGPFSFYIFFRIASISFVGHATPRLPAKSRITNPYSSSVVTFSRSRLAMMSTGFHCCPSSSKYFGVICSQPNYTTQP